MKRTVLILLFLSFVVPLKGQFVEPFDTKIVNNAIFLPYDNLKADPGVRILIVKKGTHVKVLNRSDMDSGSYRVKLDDGSIGWVPAEAFCEKSTLQAAGSYEVGGGRCRNIYVDKYIGETNLLITDHITPKEYAQINQVIEMRLLPAAFKYLKPYSLDKSQVYSRVDGTHIKGYVHKELCGLFGEPEGRIDRGFTKSAEGLGAIDYFRNIVNNERFDTMVHQYELGYCVKYDKKGIARDNGGVLITKIPYDNISSYTFRSVSLERKLKTSVEYTYNILGDGIRNYTVYSNVFTPATQKYSIPEVTDQLRADNAAYYQALAEEEYAAQRAKERAKPDSFKKVAIRFVIFLIVLYLLVPFLSKNNKTKYIHPWLRYLILLVVALALCPWPAHLLDGGKVGFWGWTGLVLAAFTALIQTSNFWSDVLVSQSCKCPGCGKWCYPEIKNEVKSNIIVDSKPAYTNRSPRILIGNTAPFAQNHKINNDDSETIIRSSDIYKIETSVPLKYRRSADKCCDRCFHTWHVDNEKVVVPVRGPIVTRAFVREDHKWYDVTKVNGQETERKENGYTKRYKGAGYFDYEHWEPYLQRYVKGDLGAIDEYYDKYFKDE